MGVIVLIRHAASLLNEENRIHGSENLDGPLSSTGKKQAAALARALTKHKIGAIYSSPAKRALDTAYVVAKTIKKQVIVIPKLQEKNHGKFEGMTWEEVWKSSPALLAAWRRDGDFRMPGGESNQDVEKRVMLVIKHLMKKHPHEIVLVFAHAGVIRNIVGYYLRIPYGRRRLLSIQNTSRTVLTHKKDRFFPKKEFVVIEKINDASHL